MNKYAAKRDDLTRRLAAIRAAFLSRGRLNRRERRELLAIQVQSAHLRDQVEAHARDGIPPDTPPS